MGRQADTGNVSIASGGQQSQYFWKHRAEVPGWWALAKDR